MDLRQVVYREGLNIGYRYFSTANVPTSFAFGHGIPDYDRTSPQRYSAAAAQPLPMPLRAC